MIFTIHSRTPGLSINVLSLFPGERVWLWPLTSLSAYMQPCKHWLTDVALTSDLLSHLPVSLPESFTYPIDGKVMVPIEPVSKNSFCGCTFHIKWKLLKMNAICLLQLHTVNNLLCFRLLVKTHTWCLWCQRFYIFLFTQRQHHYCCYYYMYLFFQTPKCYCRVDEWSKRGWKLCHVNAPLWLFYPIQKGFNVYKVEQLH